MWKKIGRWTVAVASSAMLTVPAFRARADETQQMKNNASEAGQQMKDAGKSAGNAAQSSGQAAGHATEGAWDSSKSAAKSAGNTADQAGHKAAGAVSKARGSSNDDAITSQVKQKLSSAGPPASDVDVSTKNDVVTLSGTVSSEAERARAVDLARGIDGVKQVQDHIKVNPGK
jgi:hyperosmotically inducible periplasmic protein